MRTAPVARRAVYRCVVWVALALSVVLIIAYNVLGEECDSSMYECDLEGLAILAVAVVTVMIWVGAVVIGEVVIQADRLVFRWRRFGRPGRE